MASDKDKVDTPIEESDIDHINNIISSSGESSDEKTVESDVHRIEPENSEDQESLIESDSVEVIPEDTQIEKEKPESVKQARKIEHKPEHKKIEHKESKIKVEHDAVKEHHKGPVNKGSVNKEPIHHKTLQKTDAKHISEPVKHVHKTVKPAVKHAIKPVILSKPASKAKILDNKKISRPEIKKIVKPAKAAQKNLRINNRKSFREDKMADHKEHKKKAGFKLSKNTLLWVGIGVLAAILVIALVLILSPRTPGLTSNNQTNKSVAATVNGEPIYLQDVLKTYNDLNPLVRSSYTIESVLNRSIDEMLLYQEAKNQGLTASPSEIDDALNLIKEQNNMTQASLEEAIAKQGLTMDAVRQIIAKNLLVQKLLNSTVMNDVKVTNEDILAYYTLNSDKFKVPQKVTVQHILVMVSPNVTENQSKAKIEQINKELTSTNFCELVTKYSDDTGSKNNCGIYTFAKGDFNNPEFENPSFSLGINETAIVKTVFGYHLIKKLDSIPARVENLSEVAGSINQSLYTEKVQAKFENMLKGLRAKAVIVNYVSKTNTNASVEGSNTTANLDSFAKCLTEKGATFYGAYWCPHCNNQKEMFGDSLKYVNYVECAVEGQPQVQTKVCTDAGISGYPTWIINGKSYPGEQTIASLAKMTGCTAPTQ